MGFAWSGRCMMPDPMESSWRLVQLKDKAWSTLCCMDRHATYQPPTPTYIITSGGLHPNSDGHLEAMASNPIAMGQPIGVRPLPILVKYCKPARPSSLLSSSSVSTTPYLESRCVLFFCCVSLRRNCSGSRCVLRCLCVWQTMF